MKLIQEIQTIVEAKGVKDSLSDTQLKYVLRGAATGSRIEADGKIVWPGTASTIFNSREAKEKYARKGDAFAEKMKTGKFNKVVIKDYQARGAGGQWLTAETYELTINESFTLGSKQHAELAAAAKGLDKMTVRRFKTIVKYSTMSQHDCTEITDMLNTVDADKVLTRHDIEQIAASTNTDLGELLDLSNLNEAEEKKTANPEFAKGLEAGMKALKKLRPQGKIIPGFVHNIGSASHERHDASFEYDFEYDGKTYEAAIRVDYSKSGGVSRPPQYHYSYYSFKDKNEKNARMFNPQADSGPFITDLSELGKELNSWEKHIADGLIAQKKRWEADLEKMRPKKK
jgi:hypothetical protein